MLGITRNLFSRLVAVCALLMVFSSVQAASWESRGKALFEKDDYEQCIHAMEAHKKDKMAMMLMAFCHLQKSILTESKDDKAAYQAYREQVSKQLTLSDLNDVYYFVSQADKPMVVDRARSLAGQIFDGINDMDDLHKLIPFMSVSDAGTQRMAISAVVRMLKPKRKYVGQGGTLRSKDVRAMDSGPLITALLDKMEFSGSRKALEMIEEPVLAYIGKYPGDKSAKLEKKIHARMERRLKRYPESNWYSAVGKKR